VESTPEWARLIVRDEGIGIAPEDLSRLFGRFERAVSVRHYGGLGLGLYISREITEALGGRVHVDSLPDAGATFTVELPRGGPGR
jgi:signal transduction histidine kinase